jgi:hypothetical protein
LLFVFWVLLTVCSIPQLRWEVNNYNTSHFDDGINWAGYRFIYFVTFFTLSSCMLVLNCFSDKPPSHTTYPKSSNPSPELGCSIVSRIFFGWFDKTTWIGWRSPLTESNIFDINPQNASHEMVPEFDKSFQRSLDNQKRFDDEFHNRACDDISFVFHRKQTKSGKKTDKTEGYASILSALLSTFGFSFFYSGEWMIRSSPKMAFL